MTDNVQAVDAGIQDQAPVAEPVQAQAVSETPTESPKEAPVEKVFNQDQVRAIAAKEAKRADERARAEMMAQFQRERAQAPTPQQQPTQQPTLGGMPQMTEADFQNQVQKAAWTLSQRSRAEQIEQNWLSAMEQERIADPEFGDKYDALDIESHPDLVIAMSGMDNKGAMIRDLADNTSKYANILALARENKMKLLGMELKKLSDSIKTNQNAQKQPKVDAPLGQLKPSNIAADNGDMSVSDYRNQPWLRG